MSVNLQCMYNTVFSLLEEEIYQRIHPETYQDTKYDGTNMSICRSSNIDIDMKGGNKKLDIQPGKMDIIRGSYKLNLNTAIKGSIERQRLFSKEQK